MRSGSKRTLAECQYSMVYYATDQSQKRLEGCINAEDGHSEPFYFQSHTLAFHSQLQHVILLPCINLCNAPL